MRKKSVQKKAKEASSMPVKVEECARKFFKLMNSEQESFHKKTNDAHNAFYRRTEVSFVRMLKSLREEREDVKKVLQEATSLLQNVDSTLCNVLLAIRQNEYLQAWYPKDALKAKILSDLTLKPVKSKGSVKMRHV